MKPVFPNSRIFETDILNMDPEPVSLEWRYVLKCDCCSWNTSYVDITGNLSLSDSSILCPRCRRALIEVETHVKENKKIIIIPAYLDYVLAD